MKIRNAAIASAAAALFVAGVGTPAAPAQAEEAEKIKCEGVNSCKGESSCKTLFSECAGHNECKGKGFVMLTPEECDAAKAEMSEDAQEN